MTSQLNFGERIEGFDIPVLNEREVRAAAGILFIFMFIAILMAVFDGEFLMLKFIVTFFMCDLLVRVFINPSLAPSMILGRFMVRKQKPEYVGAIQKRFAWKIGIVFSSIIFSLLVVLNTYSEIIGLSCMICLIFLFFETAFGICIGCKLYALTHRKTVQYCPGEVCEVTQRQKLSSKQMLILLGSVLIIGVTIFLLKDTFSAPPSDLWQLLETAQ